MNSEMLKQHIPGLSLAVIQNGRVVKARGYGQANVELNVPATDSSVYMIASVSKQFTAATIMLLVRDGRVHLDDPLSAYLPAIPVSWRGITIRHLLTMQAGIATTDIGRTVREDHSREDVIRTILAQPLRFAPGARFEYSNSNFVLLAEVVTVVTKQPFATVLSERIFRPLRMADTRLMTTGELVARRAGGYEWVPNRWIISDAPFPFEWYAGSAAILSTVADLAKWEIALEQETLLHRAELDAMWRPARQPGLADSTVGYGFGWFIGKVNGHRRIGHDGASNGVTSAIERHPDDGLTVILLANQEHANPAYIATRVAGLYNPSLMPPAGSK